jgi:hypothetical protein
VSENSVVVGLIFLFLNLVSSLFKSKSRLEAQNAALRQQLTVLQRQVRGRVQGKYWLHPLHD